MRLPADRGQGSRAATLWRVHEDAHMLHGDAQRELACIAAHLPDTVHILSPCALPYPPTSMLIIIIKLPSLEVSFDIDALIHFR